MPRYVATAARPTLPTSVVAHITYEKARQSKTPVKIQTLNSVNSNIETPVRQNDNTSTQYASFVKKNQITI